MSVRQVYEVIAEAWVPHLGFDIAHERARNAAMALMEHQLDEESCIATLTRCCQAARQPHYGALALSDDDISEAVARAIVALAKAQEAA